MVGRRHVLVETDIILSMEVKAMMAALLAERKYHVVMVGINIALGSFRIYLFSVRTSPTYSVHACCFQHMATKTIHYYNKECRALSINKCP